STEWLSAFAPVGSLQEDNLWVAAGAGVFFNKPPLLWLVTANHVVEAVGPQKVSVLVTRSDNNGVVIVELGNCLAARRISWARDPHNVLAATPMPVSPEFGLKAVSAGDCLSLEELLPSMPCFTVGCPYGLRGLDPQRATPLVLDGVISGVDRS